MPTCKICNTDFPNRVKIDGKTKTLTHRSHCLTCSPFGLHNTKTASSLKESIDNANATQKLCPKCNELKPLTDFYKRKNRNAYSGYCKKCVVEQSANCYRSIKKSLVDYKGGSCSICGYSKYQGALAFHHLDPSKKEFSISQYKTYAISTVKEELDKCILVCNNCHCEIHAGVTKVIDE